MNPALFSDAGFFGSIFYKEFLFRRVSSAKMPNFVLRNETDEQTQFENSIGRR